MYRLLLISSSFTCIFIKTSSKLFKMSSRTSQMFYIVASSTGRLIQMINKNRRKFSDGPWVKVHNEIICMTKDDGDKAIAGGVLFVPEDIPSHDVTSTGHLKVKRVEVCSWSTKTTAKMAAFFFGVSKLTIHKGMLDVEAIVGTRNAGSVAAILFGKGGSNMRSITQKQAKVFTERDVAPYKLRIHAYSVKDRLSVEIRLKKSIMNINNDLIEKTLLKKVGREDTTSKTTEKKSENRYGGFDEEESVEESVEENGWDTDGDGDGAALEPAGPRGWRRHEESNEEDFPTLGGSVPPVANVALASHETLATKLEDAAARGEVFAEYTPSVKESSTESDASDGGMPPMNMTTDELFALSGDIAAWA